MPARSAGAAGAAALALPAVLTHREARACLDGLLRGLPSAGAAPVAVDAATLERFDSSALAVLLACRRASPAGLAVRGAPDRLAGLARLYGVAALLGLAPPMAGGAHVPPAADGAAAPR
ncbi:MAG: STAS domain-containing protein [Xylophilus ampelinus]